MEKLMKNLAETLKNSNINDFNMEYSFTSPFYIHTKIYDTGFNDISVVADKIEEDYPEILAAFVYNPSELTGNVNDDLFIRLDLEVHLEKVVMPELDVRI